MELPQLTPPKPDCRECKLGNDSLKNPGVPAVHAEGSLHSEPSNPCFIILGQNPGFEEDKANKPFVGRSGDLVRRSILNDEGLNLNSTHCVYLLNVARCSSPAGEAIPATCYNTCYNLYTSADIHAILAHHGSATILALGKPASIRAYQLLFPKKSPGTKIADYFNVNGIKGTSPDSRKPIQCFFTYHPAAILRENKLAIPYSEHLSIIQRHIEGRVPPLSKPRVVPQEEPPSSVAMYARLSI